MTSDPHPHHDASSVYSGTDASAHASDHEEDPNAPLPVEYPGTVVPDPHPDSIDADADLAALVPADAKELTLIQCKIKLLRDLDLGRFTALEFICLRQNLLTQVGELRKLNGESLVELDLYDNRIDHILQHVGGLTLLTLLDLSFNKIRNIRNLEPLTQLQTLYLVQNKITEIKGLDTLTALKSLELGGNRIAKIEHLDSLVNLEELWLAKNRLTSLENLSFATNLRVLSLQLNRLTKITGLDALVNLEELYLSHNQIEKIEGLDHNLKLNTLDITANKVSKLENVAHLTGLTDFWALNNQLASFEDVERELGGLSSLDTVYFEGNPLQTSAPTAYVRKLKLYLGPLLAKIDANYL